MDYLVRRPGKNASQQKRGPEGISSVIRAKRWVILFRDLFAWKASSLAAKNLSLSDMEPESTHKKETYEEVKPTRLTGYSKISWFPWQWGRDSQMEYQCIVWVHLNIELLKLLVVQSLASVKGRGERVQYLKAGM
jgi:hypothetical protein